MSHYVYRAFAADDRLLYVGCTADVTRRLAVHRGDSPWWNSHARISVESFATRDDAEAAEVAAIQTEHPRWNVEHRSPDHPDGPIVKVRGRSSAPWLRDEMEQWRAERLQKWRDRRAAFQAAMGAAPAEPTESA